MHTFPGCEVPAEPFPHVNSRDELKRAIRVLVVRKVAGAIMLVALVAAGLGAGLYGLGVLAPF